MKKRVLHLFLPAPTQTPIFPARISLVPASAQRVSLARISPGYKSLMCFVLVVVCLFATF